jgi:multiple sugar transport system permease protein
MVAPAQAMLVALLFLPALYVFWLSLTRSTYGATPEWVGLSNYAVVLSDPYFWTAALNTVIVVNAVVLGEFAAGPGGGDAVRRLDPLAPADDRRGAGAVCDQRGGQCRHLEVHDGPQRRAGQHGAAQARPAELDWAVEPSHGLAMVILLSIWHHLPFTFILLYTALLGIPRDLYEAAKVDGAGAWRRSSM